MEMNADPRQPSTLRPHFRLLERLTESPQPPRVLSEAEQRALHVWMVDAPDLRFRMC